MAEIPNKPETRKETYLAAIAGQNVDLPPYPITREEAYLDEIAKNGGGGGGTTNYNALRNKPKVNDIELSGNKSLDDLGVQKKLTAGDNISIDADGTISATGGGGGSAELTSDMTTAIKVGGIESGTQYEEGTSLETIIRDMLEPTLYPTLTAPSATLAATGAKLLEKGATLATTFTATFSRGSINPAYGTSGYRSGAAIDYSLNSGTAQAGNTWNVTVSESTTSYQASVSYAAGEQPKDSKGNNYSTPLPAGSVNTNTVSYEFVDAMWANTSAIATIAKLSLVSKTAKQRDMTFPAQTVSNPEVFDVPASWTVTAVQVKNDLSGAWEDASSQFTVTDTTHNNAGSVSTAYKRYTFNMGVDTGSRQIRVKWS